MYSTLTLTGGRGPLKPCAEGMVRNEKTNRCITSGSRVRPNRPRNEAQKTKSRRPCPEGQVRNPVTKRCKNVSTSLTGSQRAEFDQMLHIMRQPVGKRPVSNRSHKRSPVDIGACLSVASDDQVKMELERRGFTVAKPVVHMLVPRKKGDPRP